MDSILFEKIGNLAKITLNRPNVFNSINQEMAFAFQDRLKECGEDDTIRAVYLIGEGKAVCAGQELQEIIAEDGPSLPNIVEKHYNPIIELIRNLEKPILGAVNGVAAGAGANIALACDIVGAKESASFIQAFSKIGLIPDSGGTYFLPRMIGFQKAAALMMLGDKIMASEADALGMIYKYFPDTSFEEESWKIAEKLAKMPTKGLALTKKALNYSLVNDLTKQLAMEGEFQSMAGMTKDYQEGVQAFLEKRKPNFTGE